MGIALVSWLLVAACGPSRADMTRLQDRLAKLQSTRQSEREQHDKASKKLRNRIARLEAELAVVRRTLAARATAPAPRPSRPAEASPPKPAGPRASCPADLPKGARKLRRRMRASKVRELLRGVRLRRSQTTLLTGKGARTRAVWAGPCFRVTLANGEVTRVELEGAEPRRRPRRRRHRRRRR